YARAATGDSGNRIENTWIHDQGAGATTTRHHHCLYLNMGGMLVRGNLLERCWANGITGGNYGGASNPKVVEGNVIRWSGNGSSRRAEGGGIAGCDHMIVRNNLIYGNRNGGVQ